MKTRRFLLALSAFLLAALLSVTAFAATEINSGANPPGKPYTIYTSDGDSAYTVKNGAALQIKITAALDATYNFEEGATLTVVKGDNNESVPLLTGLFSGKPTVGNNAAKDQDGKYYSNVSGDNVTVTLTVTDDFK